MERMVIRVTPARKQAIAARVEEIPMGKIVVRRTVERRESAEDAAASERPLHRVTMPTNAAMEAIGKTGREAADPLNRFAAQRRAAA